jgi:agmatine/peptidylarginine deiminase
MLLPCALFAQQPEPLLTHEMSAAEALNKGSIGKAFVETPPPFANPRNVAEYEPMEGAIVRYPFGIPYPLIAEMSQNTLVWTIANGSGNIQNVINLYTSNGVNLTNCRFIDAPSNTYWTRDYGPWFIQYTDSNDVRKTGIVDFPYNRPRPLDDEIPKIVADSFNIEWFGMKVIHTGGNYMTTGMGKSSSSDLTVVENPTQTVAQINQKFLDYLGVSDYDFVPDPNLSTGIDHIDCYGKYLAPDKVLIRSVPPSNGSYAALEATALHYASYTSPYGTPYKIYRVYTPNDQPYTNSVILNNKVLVPTMNQLQYDTAALHVYELAMPGYQVFGFNGLGGGAAWISSDALHCRVNGLADRGMLRIEHIPVSAEQAILAPVNIAAKIEAMSGMGLIPDSCQLYYKVNGGNYSAISLAAAGNNAFTATIPGQPNGSTVSYYLHAADSSGRAVSHAIMGAADPHIYTVGTVGIGEMPDEFNGLASISTLSPNPFSRVTLFDFTMNGLAEASVEVFDIQGNKIKTLLNQPVGPGFYSLGWDASNEQGTLVAAGCYFIKLSVNGNQSTRKVIYTK